MCRADTFKIYSKGLPLCDIPLVDKWSLVFGYHVIYNLKGIYLTIHRHTASDVPNLHNAIITTLQHLIHSNNLLTYGHNVS
jgi:hypothetical protein